MVIVASLLLYLREHYTTNVATQAVIVNLPGPLYERLVRRATKTHRTIEAELIDAVATLPTSLIIVVSPVPPLLSALVAANRAARSRTGRSASSSRDWTDVSASQHPNHSRYRRECGTRRSCNLPAIALYNNQTPC